MIEILIVWQLGKAIAARARDKGRGAAGYVLMLIGLWIVGEFTGAIVGAVLFGPQTLLIYLFAMVGAAIGAIITFTIVGALSDRSPQTTRFVGGFPVMQSAARSHPGPVDPFE